MVVSHTPLVARVRAFRFDASKQPRPREVVEHVVDGLDRRAGQLGCDCSEDRFSIAVRGGLECPENGYAPRRHAQTGGAELALVLRMHSAIVGVDTNDSKQPSATACMRQESTSWAISRERMRPSTVAAPDEIMSSSTLVEASRDSSLTFTSAGVPTAWRAFRAAMKS